MACLMKISNDEYYNEQEGNSSTEALYFLQ